MADLAQALAEVLSSQRAASLEEMLTSREWFGLETATVMQRAICRVADGRPLGELAELRLLDNADEYDAEVRETLSLEHAFCTDIDGNASCSLSELPQSPPREVDLYMGIRSGKSLITATKALHASQTVDTSAMRQGQIARIPILSLSKDNATEVYNHFMAAAEQSSAIRSLIVDANDSDAKRFVMLRHPSGHLIEVRIVAGRRAGGSLVSRWVASCIIDEATRMLSSDDAVINLDEAYKAVKGRILPGGQIWFIGSPYVAVGPAYERAASHAGNPSEARVVTFSSGPAMNPYYWTPERVREVSEQGDDEQPDKSAEEVRITDILGRFLPLGYTGRLDPGLVDWLDRCPTQKPGDMIVSGSDLAFKTNSSAQAIGWLRRERYIIRHVEEWQPIEGQQPQPTKVCASHRANMERYGAVATLADGHYRESLREALIGTGLLVNDAPAQRDAVVRLRRVMADGQLAIWCDAAMKKRLRDQLTGTRLIPTPNGMRVEMKTSRDGSHCDLVAALALCVWQEAGPAVEGDLRDELPEGWTMADMKELHKSLEPEQDLKKRKWRSGTGRWR